MTGIAIQRSVRADQREAVEVLVDLLDRNVPPLYGVALFAVRPHLALVDVGVAVRAARSHIREHRLGVALGAAHTLVHAAQGILGGVVIELRDGTNGFPTAERVAVLAGDAQAPVGASCVRGRLRLSTCQFPARENR